MLTCELDTCRKSFEPKKPTQRYCSRLCGGTHGRNQARANRIAGRVPDGPLPATRAEARAIGSYLYLGKRCDYGHFDGRYTSTAKCVRCWAIRSRKDGKPSAQAVQACHVLSSNWAPVVVRRNAA